MSLVVLLVASAIFLIGYAAIALEQSLRVSKSAIALITGTILWIIVAIYVPAPVFQAQIEQAGAEVFSIIVFLLAAMSLVEILVHYGFFDFVREKLYDLKLKDTHQFIVITAVSFLLSAVIDNLTTTIIMIQVARKFFSRENFLIASAGIVISANAGGAFSPIGDVTTIMLWFANKFGTLEVIVKAFLPSFMLWLVAVSLLLHKLRPGNDEAVKGITRHLARSDKYIIRGVFVSFGLPLLVSLIGLPPYVGLLLGLGCVWLLIDVFKRFNPSATHLSASIEHLIRKIDVSSLKFFIGILLAVSALHALGILERLALLIYTATPGNATFIAGNILMGLLSSVLDNVPLTAIAIHILNTSDSNLWILLALTVGTGGSMLVIGSAAGVVAMGINKDMTFMKYFRVAFIPAFAGYVAAVGTWYLQYLVTG